MGKGSFARANRVCAGACLGMHAGEGREGRTGTSWAMLRVLRRGREGRTYGWLGASVGESSTRVRGGGPGAQLEGQQRPHCLLMG